MKSLVGSETLGPNWTPRQATRTGTIGFSKVKQERLQLDPTRSNSLKSISTAGRPVKRRSIGFWGLTTNPQMQQGNFWMQGSVC